MVRELQVQMHKPTPAEYKAAVDMTVGMAVVKDEATKTVKFADADTSVNVFVVDKERIPSDANTGRTIFSDYDEDFMTIKKGEFVKLHAYNKPERFAVDQVADDIASASYVCAGADGKWKASAEATKYIYCGEYNDAGHVLHTIEVGEVG